MQTFLSENTFSASVGALDNVRLQKQYLEGWQILDAIAKTPLGGGQRIDGKVPFASNHPATNMWRGHEYQLMVYLRHCRNELISRDIKTDVVSAKIAVTAAGSDWRDKSLPAWWEDEQIRVKIETTHRASLWRKMPEHYPDFYACSERLVATYPEVLLCCDRALAGKHQPYYYPTHAEV